MVPILRSLLYNWGQDDDFVRNACLEIALHNFWDIFQVKYRILFVDFKGKKIKIMMMEMVCWDTYFPRAEWKKVCVCQRCVSAIFKCGPAHPWLQTAPLGPGATLSYAPALSPFFRRNKCGHFLANNRGNYQMMSHNVPSSSRKRAALIVTRQGKDRWLILAQDGVDKTFCWPIFLCATLL